MINYHSRTILVTVYLRERVQDVQEDVLVVGGVEQPPIPHIKNSHLIRQGRADVKYRHGQLKLPLLPPQTVSGITASGREPGRKDFAAWAAIASGQNRDPVAAGCKS